MKIALTIAGSDTSAGAGIQADLKTFLSLGVYGCTAITTITSQNSTGISGILEIPPNMIERQILGILDDIKPDAIKIGMMYGKNAIISVSKVLKDSKIPMILDPLMIAGTGERLLHPDAIAALCSHLLPLSTVVTPNVFEAQVLSNIKITSLKSVISAAFKIKKMGATNVIVKGGHLSGRFSTDIILNSQNQVSKISNPRLKYERMHGGGCTFSASLTAYIAKNFLFSDACKLANRFTNETLRTKLLIGQKLIVNNQMSKLYALAESYEVFVHLQRAVEMIESTPRFGRLIPETQSNIAYSIANPDGTDDIMAVKGRIIKVGDIAKPASGLAFGASKHVAMAILEYMNFIPDMRSAMNIKHDPRVISLGRKIFSIASYDRMKEPKQLKNKEGLSISWGIKQALLKNPSAELIYHKGDFAKEPMTMVFAPTPVEVVKKIKRILRDY